MIGLSLSRPVGTIFELFSEGFEEVDIRKWKFNVLIYNCLINKRLLNNIKA